MFAARYLLNLSMALNQLASAILAGNPHMSTSARAGYARERGSKGGAFVCHLLEAIDPHLINDKRPPETKIPGDHCSIARFNYENK